MLDATVSEVNGLPTGSLGSAVLQASAYAGSHYSFGYAQGAGAIRLPLASASNVSVYGTLDVSVFDETGTTVLCTTSISIPTQSLTVTTNTDTAVTVVADLSPAMCDIKLIGDVGLTGGVNPYFGYMYTGGTPWLSDSFDWSNGNQYQAYEFTGLQRTTYRPYGYLYFDAPYSGEYLQMPYYDQPAADLTNGGTVRRDFRLDGAFVTGNFDVGGPAASLLNGGSQQFQGQWVWDSSYITAGPTSGGYASTPIDASTGNYQAVLTAGPWSAYANLSFYSSHAGVTNYSYLYVYGGPTFTATAGATTQAPDQSTSVSEGVITFDVIEPDGTPTIGITNPYVYASFYDPATGQSISAYGYAYVTNAATPSVHLIGPAGTYTFTAYATVNGANTQFAQSTITIGTAVGTPTGTGVVVVPEDAQGNPTPITITFAEVTVGGETTASVTGTGPGAPAGYELLEIVGTEQFLNLSTSATFTEAEICVTYDPAALSLTAADEADLVLQAFVCSTDGNCAWQVLSNGTVDVGANELCGTTTVLGTFGITLPLAPIITVEGTCVGAADNMVAVATDPGLCSASVDNNNQVAGGCSTDGLASCLFDGVSPLALAPGSHEVSVLATGTDGSTDGCSSFVEVSDLEAPGITCGAGAVVECGGLATAATVSASCGDNCGSCSATCGDGTYPLGTSTVACNATDAAGNSSGCNTSVTVVDTVSPTLAFTATPSVLWPPNHKLRAISLPSVTQDACDATPVVSCTATSSEPDNGLGDGDTANDIQWVNGGLLLRAERRGGGPGRTYTITCTATDDSGHSGSVARTVTVPANRSN